MKFKITKSTYQTGRGNINIAPVKLGYFAIQNEVNQMFIMPLLAKEFDIDFGKQPEISVGMVFSRYLKENNILREGDIDFMEQRVNNYRRIKPKIYSNRLLIIFKEFFYKIWLPNYGGKYYPNIDQLIRLVVDGDSLAS